MAFVPASMNDLWFGRVRTWGGLLLHINLAPVTMLMTDGAAPAAAQLLGFNFTDSELCTLSNQGLDGA